MSGGRNERPWGRQSDSTSTLVVVGLLMVATVAPWVGTAIASPTGAPADGTATDAVQILPDPLNETENETTDSVGGTLPTIDDPISTTVGDDLPTTEDSTSTAAETTTHPGEGNGPPDDVPGANRTPNETSPGPPSDGPSNGTTPPGLGDSPPANRTLGPNPPREPGRDRLSGKPGRANVSGLPANRTGPPGRTGPPNGTTRGPRRPNDVERVNATVENATANQSVAVNVSRPDARDDDVSFESVNVTPTRNASFTLNVTASEEPISEKTPSVELSNGTRPLAYLSVDHSIDDENISNVTFTFRVRRDRVNASERDEIALYRFHGGTWNELPTTLVATTATHYVYRVRSPGLSEFAAGKQTARFEITAASVEVTTLSVGDALKVRVRITNRGKADGTFTAELVLGDRPVARRHLTIASGGMRQTTFERTVAEPGTYEVWVNDYEVGEVTVNGTATTDDGSTEHVSNDPDRDRSDPTGTDGGDPTGTDGSDTANGTNANVPGLGVAAAIGALLAGLAAALRWRR